MRQSALVLAAHGSTADASSNARIHELAAELRRRGIAEEVTPAFHLGTPTFATVLDTLAADRVTVVPVMTSRGYFADTVLPRELARNRRFPKMQVVTTRPVGTHPELGSLLARRVGELLRTYASERDMPPHEALEPRTLARAAADGPIATPGQSHGPTPAGVAVALIGHGTPRHNQSRLATEELSQKLAAHLRGRLPSRAILTAFLDEPPLVERLLERSEASALFAIPFLIGGGPHTARDIPARLGISKGTTVRLPVATHVNGRLIVCDVPVGSYDGILDIIVDLANGADSSETEP